MLKWGIAFLLIVFTTSSISEPTPLVAKLMETPASLLDVGLIKVQKQLDSYGKGYTITYDWEKNKFIVHKYFSDLMNEKMECKTEAACKDFLKSITEKETDLLCFPMEDNCSLINIASEFAHSGYSVKNFYSGKNDAESVKELRKLFYVNTTLIKKFNGVSKKILCERAIIDAQALCSDAIEIGKK